MVQSSSRPDHIETRGIDLALGRYEEVVSRVAAAAQRSDRAVDEVTIVAVSKTKTPEEIQTVYDLGHRDFGENRAQELAAKAPHLPDDIRWHFVGSLQSNKVRLVRGLTHMLHSMDRRSLARAWLKGPGAPAPVLLEVNIAQEPQKAGIAPEDIRENITGMASLGVDMQGLMAIPPIPDRPEQSRPFFRQLRELKESLLPDWPMVNELSMGMTDDFEVAIEEGASIIRVGRAIFGPRN